MDNYPMDKAVFKFAVAEITKLLLEDYFLFGEDNEVRVNYQQKNSRLKDLAYDYLFEIRENYQLYKKWAEATPK